MSDTSIDEIRKCLAFVRASLENAQASLELGASTADTDRILARERAVEEIRRATVLAEALATQVGGVSAPVRH